MIGAPHAALARVLVVLGMAFAVVLSGPGAQAAAVCMSYPYQEKQDLYRLEHTDPVSQVRYKETSPYYQVAVGEPYQEYRIQTPNKRTEYMTERRSAITEYTISYIDRWTEYYYDPYAYTDNLWSWNDYDEHHNQFRRTNGSGETRETICRVNWYDTNNTASCGEEGHNGGPGWVHTGHYTVDHFHDPIWYNTTPPTGAGTPFLVRDGAGNPVTRDMYHAGEWGRSVPSRARYYGQTRTNGIWQPAQWRTWPTTGTRGYDWQWTGEERVRYTDWNRSSFWRRTLPTDGNENITWRVAETREVIASWSTGTWQTSLPAGVRDQDYRVAEVRTNYNYQPATWMFDLPEGENGAEYNVVNQTTKVRPNAPESPYVDLTPALAEKEANPDGSGGSWVRTAFRIDYRRNGVFESFSVADAKSEGLVRSNGTPLATSDVDPSVGLWDPTLRNEFPHPDTTKYVLWYYGMEHPSADPAHPSASQYRSLFGSPPGYGQLDAKSTQCQVVRPT